MKVRKIPLRKCVACNEMLPKRELTRVVKTPDDEILLAPTGKRSGRGAYLCSKADCFQLAQKTKALDRALKQEVTAEIYETLARQVMGRNDE